MEGLYECINIASISVEEKYYMTINLGFAFGFVLKHKNKKTKYEAQNNLKKGKFQGWGSESTIMLSH